MAAGQALLTGTLDVAALTAVEVRLEVMAQDRAAAHGRRLRTVLELHALLSAAGAELSTTALLALVDQVAEQTSQALLTQAQLLRGLPGGLEAVDCGLLSVEHATVLTRQLLPLDGIVRLHVWHAIRALLLRAHDAGAVTPPARFAADLRRAVLRCDAANAIARRKTAESLGSVEVTRRDDGLVDLILAGMNPLDAQAVMQRIRDRSLPFGSADDRMVGRRRLDAATDLLLGRDHAPLEDSQNPFHQTGPVRCGPSCGCRNGQPVPCGIGVSILVPIGAALGSTDEVAELDGHGPVEPDLLQAVLHHSAVLRAVFVDDTGTPVATAARTVTLPRGDAAGVRQALLDLVKTRPTRSAEPRHPDDHPPDRHPPGGHSPGQPPPDMDLTRAVPAGPSTSLRSLARRQRPSVLARPHPTGTPGPYRLPTHLVRLLRVRAPRCEWPGCGHRAHRCDLDHDHAWPHGPTCGCNCGPLCRRHHRLKQLLMTKQRTPTGVTWTGPTGRRWTSPNQHHPPQTAVRPLPPLVDLRGPGDPSLTQTDGPDTGPWDVLRVDDPLDQTSPTTDDQHQDVFLELLRDPWGLRLDEPVVSG